MAELVGKNIFPNVKKETYFISHTRAKQDLDLDLVPAAVHVILAYHDTGKTYLLELFLCKMPSSCRKIPKSAYLTSGVRPLCFYHGSQSSVSQQR